MFIKDHPNSPYYDDSYLDMQVFRLDGYTPDGEIIDSSWVIEEDIDREMRIMHQQIPNSIIKVVPCELGDCPEHVQERILEELADIKAQDDYENIRYYRELY